MSRASHQLLNTVLPASVRSGLRRLAVATIPGMRHLEMPFRLSMLARAGISPAVIYDIGAATGEWAHLAHRIWPAAKIVGFEPNQSRVDDLERTKAELPGFSYHRCFLGAAPQEAVTYKDDQEQTSLYSIPGGSAAGATAPMHTLDQLIASKTIPAPDFLKLDVQGYEIEVLAGGRSALANAVAAMLEVSVYPFAPGVPTINDVLAFMRERGFEMYDLAGAIRRPKDDRLAQLDVIFLKQDHALLVDTAWA